MPVRFFLAVFFVFVTTAVAQKGGRVEYAGGTLPIQAGADGALDTHKPGEMVLQLKRWTVQVPYKRINLLEYGQNVNRRLALAIVISPLFLLSKARKHFLTIGFQGHDEAQQAVVLRVNKKDVRSVLASLEARTGLKVQYQDDEARKAGKG